MLSNVPHALAAGRRDAQAVNRRMVQRPEISSAQSWVWVAVQPE